MIVLLVRDGDSSRYLYHALRKEFQIGAVIIEGAPPVIGVLQRRIRRLGFSVVAGQLLFQLFVRPLLRWESKKRVREIEQQSSLNSAPIPEAVIQRVRSVNSPECRALLGKLSPSMVIVNGTRIIKTEILNATECPFINTHVGITPQYRGVHGGYWALASGDRTRCGVTIHRVDEGVDTGAPIVQTTIEPTRDDNFCSYPVLQYAAAIPLLIEVLRSSEVQSLSFSPTTVNEFSKQWYLPTAGQYLTTRFKAGIR
jgi:folate-dependent phosphoribosylglycinamide formyltransferase PurN